MSDQERLSDFTQEEQESTKWEERTFSEVIEVNNYPPLKKGEEETYVAMDDLDEFERKVKRTSKKEYKYSAPRFKNGDTLFPKMSRCLELGKTAYVDVLDKDEIAFGSTEFIVMRPKDDEVLPKFVYYTVRRVDIRQHALSWATGSTARRQRISTDLFDKLTIKVPPIEKQKEIISFLDAIDTKIEVNNYINELLKEIAQTVYKSWFVDFDPYDEFNDSELGEIPVEFDVVEVGELVKIRNGKSAPDDKYTNDEDKYQYPAYGGNGITGSCSEKFANQPVVVAGRVGAYCGNIHRTLGKCWVTDNAMMVEPNSKRIGINLLYEVLNNFNLNKYRRGTSQPMIAQDTIKNRTFALPPKSDVEKYEERVSNFYSKIKQNNQENDVLAELRDTLLPKVMSGEIRLDQTLITNG